MSGLKKILFLSFALIVTIPFLIGISYSVPIIPGEEGFGINTKGGRGGDIYKVTNLDSSGNGSLRECVDAIGPRICLFEVSGTINLTTNLEIHNPYITIAGQSAPSPGITIAGAGISIQSNDILIQHIRIRVGDNLEGPNPEDRDAITIGSNSRDVYNIVIDHISASWAIDEVISTWSVHYLVYNVSILNSIFSEGLFNSIHPDGRHSMGALIGKNSRNILIKNNLFVHNYGRNPLVRDDATDIIIANNLIYNSGAGSKSQIYFGTRGNKDIPLRASVIGNVYITGNANKNTIYIEQESATDTQIYLKDNIGPFSDKSQWEMALGRDRNEVQEYSAPVWIEGLKIIPADELKGTLLKTAGARPLDRDAVDQRIINDILSNSGKIINSQKDVGGWPELDENTRKLSIPQKPNKDSNKNGYTNIEEWLHLYSYDVEIKKINISKKPDKGFANHVFSVAEYITINPYISENNKINFSTYPAPSSQEVIVENESNVKFYIYALIIIAIILLLVLYL
jgi:hypothetical protein